MLKVYFVQQSDYAWQIESESGKVIQKDITCASIFKAEEYIKNYVSSFINWDYELKLLTPSEGISRGESGHYISIRKPKT